MSREEGKRKTLEMLKRLKMFVWRQVKESSNISIVYIYILMVIIISFVHDASVEMKATNLFFSFEMREIQFTFMFIVLISSYLGQFENEN